MFLSASMNIFCEHSIFFTAEIKELEQIFLEMSSSNEEINLVNNDNRDA